MVDYERVEIDDVVQMTLSLSRNEALYIDDSLSLLIERTDADRMIGTMRLLLLSAHFIRYLQFALYYYFGILWRTMI